MISDLHTINSKPLISIVMNCFNGEKYLLESLESIQKQTYKNWELIFWDNISTDKSKEIFESFEDKRFKYYSAAVHTPLSKARNLALNKCKGDFIAFLDVDDWWSLNKLELQIKLFADSSVQLVYGNFLVNNFKKKTVIYGIPARKIEPNKKAIMYDFNLPSGYILDSLMKEYVVGMMTIMIRKEIILNHNYRFNESISILCDLELVLKISSKFKIACCKNVIAHKRLHDENNFNKNKEEILKQFTKIYEYLYNKPDIFKKKSVEFFRDRILYEKFVYDLNKYSILKSIYFFFKLSFKYKLQFLKLLYLKFT
jgi:glycosyltransferase involved in cell wall biosynthesis|tara:strand:+ start:16839 stop:17774 length:936 start_codon:yes stop_codon:yes gene_type:complete